VKKRRVLPLLITKKWLKMVGACDQEVEEFDRVFPAGTCITPDSILTAVQNNLHITWIFIYLMRKRIISSQKYHSISWRYSLVKNKTAEAQENLFMKCDSLTQTYRRQYMITVRGLMDLEGALFLAEEFAKLGLLQDN
jgi:hypothetical protein